MDDFLDRDLRGARFARVDLSGARFDACDFTGTVMRGADLINVRIHGSVENLVINEVDVAPLITAELDRRHPERVKMRPGDPDGFREAWALLDRLWHGTIDKARGLPPEQLHASVDGEWSFVETVRHLSFASHAWVSRAIKGQPSPWDPLDLPFDEMSDLPGVPRDRQVRPTLDETLQLRDRYRAKVSDLLDGLTTKMLDSATVPVDEAGWPGPEPYPVRSCLLIVLNEEWQHRLYAERDLDQLLTLPHT